MKAKNSIIIAAYNVLEYTKQCIYALRERLAGKSYEIIVIDNGSTDSTYQWLSIAPDLRVIRNEENRGLAAAWNQGLAIAEGDTLLFMHNDIVLSKNAFCKMKELLWSREDIGMVGPVMNRCFGRYQHISGTSYRTQEGIDSVAYFVERNFMPRPLLFLDGGCFMVKRVVAEAVGGFDECYLNAGIEAIDFSLSVVTSGYFLVAANAYVHHELGSFAKNNMSRSDILARNEDIFFEKWGFHQGYSLNTRFELLSNINASKENLCVLDIGCSCGGNLMWLKYHNSRAELYGIELNRSAARIAGLFGNVEAVDVESIAKDEWRGKFDYIIMGDILEHLRNPWKTLRTIREYLKPDGRAIICIPNINHISILISLLNGMWDYREEGILDRTHLRFFTRRSFLDALKEAGLRCCLIDSNNVSLTDTAEQFMKSLCALDGVGAKEDELRAYQWKFVVEKDSQKRE